MLKKLGKIALNTILVEGLKLGVKSIMGIAEHKYEEAHRNRHYSFTVTSETPEMYQATVDWLDQLSLNITERHVLCESAGSSRSDKGSHSFPVGTFNFYLGKTKLVIAKTLDKENKYNHQTIIKICFFGQGAKEVFLSVKSFVEEKCSLGKVQICRLHNYSSSQSSKPKRSIDSVVMKDLDKAKLLDHLNTFVEMKATYAEAGIPYKTGILLEGPPGTGKTSLTLAIASHLNYDVMYVTPASVQNDSTVLGEAKPRTVIVFEDFDKFFSVKPEDKAASSSSRRKTVVNVEKDDGDQKRIQFLLSFLDGFASPDECVFVMSTNHPEVLDQTLLRDGRVDLRLFMPHFTKDLAYKMGANFGVTKAYIDKLPKTTWSIPSKLQSNLLKLVFQQKGATA
jgi:hypothetical protein